MYLWMSVYDNSGKPKYQRNLGPGEKNMGKFILDWTTGDFTGTSRNAITELQQKSENNGGRAEMPDNARQGIEGRHAPPLSAVR